MIISGRPLDSGDVIRIDSHLLERLALKVYDECALDYCSNPSQLARRLGLRVQPTRGHGEIIGEVLLSPSLRSRREMGYAIYNMLGAFLLRRAGHPFGLRNSPSVIADFLILPRCVAAQISDEELAVVQRFAPLDALQRIYDSYRRRDSGLLPVAMPRADSAR